MLGQVSTSNCFIDIWKDLPKAGVQGGRNPQTNIKATHCRGAGAVAQLEQIR